GPTDLRNLVLLCGFHHRLIHHGDWEVRMAADGLPEFIPPQYRDPLRHPRRNTLHHV
ncbi:HNH endonuclease, partial [Amycolatopsis lurida]